ncbi:hypothetical protein [Deinococcus cellulosilyticus]|uniref:Alcohol dehydrogenase n=1 Tax=Deinococcus cellulosilyticus (strain DSM 18568 / NBRC 106333 / KACC 11606 / 5516J-15) TaxID=1223518 RepID=A0A511N612_DEIC1|nr:hypothetical protein [Deinococcus cellulosilyticus]GEM48300.1 alcohol dehydrogenase [Deinococcus cellulosilyticus NBRC 106333 = KACC 11606]
MAKKLLLKAPLTLEWEDHPVPALKQDHVVLRTLKTAVSVSSTLSEYLGNIPVSYPRAAGYESLALVEETSDPEAFPVGMRVVATYGHTDHLVLPVHRLVPVPEPICDEVALLSILVCDAFKGVYRVRPRSQDRVLVMGAGVMGILTAWNLLALGMQVDIHDPLHDRLELARHMGARPVDPTNQSGGYTCGFECSGNPEAFSMLQSAMSSEGRICVLSDGNWGSLQLTRDFHQRELAILAASDGLRYQDHARIFFREVEEQQSLLKRLYDLEVSSADLIPTFEWLAVGPRPRKILVHW